MKRILLIEDDAVLRENTAELLELSDFDVITASNGKSGVEMAKINFPDIIVCDIMMPELDGYGVLSALSKNESTKFTPFIFLSAKTEHKDVRKGMDMGADDYITKPFNEEELISAIESRIAKASILKDTRDKSDNANFEEPAFETISSLKNFFVQNGQIFTYTNGDTIYGEGHNSNYIYLIIKGLVKCYKLNEQGKELTTALYKKDDLFGYTSFAQNVPYQETAMVIKDTELASFSKNELKNVLNSNHNLTLQLIQFLTEDLKGMKDQLLQMAYGSVQKKTAITILKFAEKLNKDRDEPIRISRNDLASVAGVATETFIRTLSNFKNQGLIEIEGRNIKILNLQKLQSLY